MGLFDRKEKVTKPQSPPAQKRPSLPSPPATDQLRPPTTAPQEIRPFSAPPAQGASFAPPAPWSLSPPQGWASPPPPGSGFAPYAYPPVVVNHNYYLPSVPVAGGSAPGGMLSLQSMADLADKVFPSANFPSLLENGQPTWTGYGGQLMGQGTAIYDQLFHRFNDVMTNIDGDRFSGNEDQLFNYGFAPVPGHVSSSMPMQPVSNDVQMKNLGKAKKEGKEQPKAQTTAIAASMISGSHFSKVDLYANSRLPLDLPPLTL
jgi:hypothetical protein